MSTGLRPLTRSYAVADLNAMELKPVSNVIRALDSKKRKATDDGDETDHLSTDGPDSPKPAPKRKPGRPKGSKNKASNQQPNSNKLHDTDIEMSPPKASKNRNVVPPRSPLPNRINRVVNPGRPDAKRTKRTSAEVTAAAKRKEDLRKEIEEHDRRKIQALAEIELQEEMEAAEEENNEVNERGNGMEDEEAPPQSEDIMEEDPVDKSTEFEITADSGIEPDAGKNALAKHTRKKKPAKGETRTAVNVAKETIKARQKRKSSIDLQKSAPKKAKPAFPSGLVNNWQAKATTSKSKAPSGKSKAVPKSDDEKIGGLADEDAFAEAPASTPLGKSRNTNRNNELVQVFEVVDSDSDSDVLVPFKVKPVTSRNLKAKVGAESKLNIKKEDVATRQSTVKAEPSVKLEGSTSAGSILSASTQDIETLPEFCRATWSTRFLPTIYHRLGAASKPWELADGEAGMVDVIQEVLDYVYPGTTYTVKHGDKIFTMAKNRLNEKRTYFGREAIRIVREHFGTEKYKNHPKRISSYARWAVRGDGPAIFETPTPIDCVVSKKSPDYIKPDGIFCSNFVIALFAPYAKWCKGSCHDYGELKGALAMSAAGLERAFLMYKSGVPTDVGQFSRDKVGTLVDDYLVNTAKLTSRRWEHLMETCGVSNEELNPPLDTSVMQQDRRNLYVPSSPAQGSN